MNAIHKALVAVALALTLSAPALADPPAGKGNDKSAQQGSQEQQGKSGQKGKDDKASHDDRYDDKDSNHGSVVSECNHRANERNLKGQDRKEWTEWCEERGSRYSYDYKRYSTDRNCYQKADNKGLTGDKRRKFINDCLDIPNRF
jgi:psiF repeat